MQKQLSFLKIKQAGFSLLELLVVISIIGILIALGTASYTTAQKKGRDARRQSDIKSIQNAFEQYYALNTTYPVGEGCIDEVGNLNESLPAGMPVDPKTGEDYILNCDATGDNYCICALLDQTGTGNSGANCNFAAVDKDYYCQTNQQ